LTVLVTLVTGWSLPEWCWRTPETIAAVEGTLAVFNSSERRVSGPGGTAMDAHPCSLIKALNLETPNARFLQLLRSYTIQQPLAVVRQQPADVQYGERPAGQVTNPSQRETAARQ